LSGQKSAGGRSRLTQRTLFLDLAARGLRMPIGADMILDEEPDPESVRNSGDLYGKASYGLLWLRNAVRSRTIELKADC
jgi:hypothetical protein